MVETQVDPHGAPAGVAIGVSGSNPLAQAVLALVDGGALVLVSRQAAVDAELARTPLPTSSGPVVLTVTAFDDRVRAQVGVDVVEADRGAVREGRIALVADGAAVFDRLTVDGVDLYRVPFMTSRYPSFATHIADRVDAVAAHPADGMGAPPAGPSPTCSQPTPPRSPAQ